MAEVDQVPVVRRTVLGRVLAHRRDEDPVPERQAAELEGRKQCAGHRGAAVSGAWAAASIPGGRTRARGLALHCTSPLTLAEKSLYNPASLKSGAAPSRPGFF